MLAEATQLTVTLPSALLSSCHAGDTRTLLYSLPDSEPVLSAAYHLLDHWTPDSDTPNWTMKVCYELYEHSDFHFMMGDRHLAVVFEKLNKRL